MPTALSLLSRVCKLAKRCLRTGSRLQQGDKQKLEKTNETLTQAVDDMYSSAHGNGWSYSVTATYGVHYFSTQKWMLFKCYFVITVMTYIVPCCHVLLSPQQHAWWAAASETLWHHLGHQSCTPTWNWPPVYQEALRRYETFWCVWRWRGIKPQVGTTSNTSEGSKIQSYLLQDTAFTALMKSTIHKSVILVYPKIISIQ